VVIGRIIIAALLLLLAAHTGLSEAAEVARAQGKVLPAYVDGTSLIVPRPDGGRAEGKALIGAVVVGGDPERGPAAFRVDAVRQDPEDPEVTLYDLSVRDPTTGQWQPHCRPDGLGIAGALFLSGSWDARGTHHHDDKFSVSCTSGAIGKCVRAGYKPWKIAADGRSMWDYHQACTRLVRADYCGDGMSRTRDGIQVEIIDRLGRREDLGTDLVFEAGWTPEGASCVVRPRLHTWSINAVSAACPHKLQDRVGESANCRLADELGQPDVLLVNKFRPTVP
jgi:hypothetical protein